MTTQLQATNISTEIVQHVTVLSNFARAYDKYRGAYDKTHIPESTFPGKFFVLRPDEIKVGIAKASRLLEKTALAGDHLIILEAALPSDALHPNTRTGKGRFLAADALPVQRVHIIEGQAKREISIEEAYAASLAVLNPTLPSYEALTPRTVSVLPIAFACQAACRFCFSESSASLEQLPHTLDLARVDEVCRRAAKAGARRFVLTGGGEPGLVKHQDLLAFIRLGRSHFEKVVLITNGVHLAKLDDKALSTRLRDYGEAGLGILSISRHFHEAAGDSDIMGLDTRTERVLAQALAHPAIRMRLVCVLQKGGIEDNLSVANYLDWASGHGVQEMCFKELYVSTTLESVYSEAVGNIWSRENQVSLSLIVRFCEGQGFTKTESLPWGAPIYEGLWHGRPMRIAAYTEPSLYWEKSNGVLRSWNIMADGSCLASLEDPKSNLDFTA